MWICFFSWMCELTLHVVYWQCYELLNTIYLSLFACLLPIYSWESQTCENDQTIWCQWDVYSLFFSLLSEETSWTNKSQAWKNERGNDRYVLKKVLMPFTRYLHLLNIVCITYPLHHVSLAITMNTMYKCTSCQSHQIVSLLNFLQRFGVVWVMTQIQVQHLHVCQGGVIFWNVVLCMEKNYMQLIVFV